MKALIDSVNGGGLLAGSKSEPLVASSHGKRGQVGERNDCCVFMWRKSWDKEMNLLPQSLLFFKLI